MGIRNDLSIAFRRVKSELNRLIFSTENSCMDENINYIINMNQDKRNDPHLIPKRLVSEHPLFDSSSQTRISPLQNQIKFSNNISRNITKPRNIKAIPLQQRVQTTRTSSVPLQFKEKITKKTSLPPQLIGRKTSKCPVCHIYPISTGKPEGHLSFERIFLDSDSESYVSKCSSGHFYEEIPDVGKQKTKVFGESFLESISKERRKYISRFRDTGWDIDETSYSY